jgi:hypothetical protein
MHHPSSIGKNNIKGSLYGMTTLAAKQSEVVMIRQIIGLVKEYRRSTASFAAPQLS